MDINHSEKVDKPLVKRVEQEVSKPVQYPNYASPIIFVLMQDEIVRICASYKV